MTAANESRPFSQYLPSSRKEKSELARMKINGITDVPFSVSPALDRNFLLSRTRVRAFHSHESRPFRPLSGLKYLYDFRALTRPYSFRLSSLAPSKNLP